MPIPKTETPFFITVCHSRPMETNYENNKFHRVINHDKQGVFLQGEGVGNFFYISCVFKIFNTLFPHSPLEEKPLFYHCLSLDGNQKILVTVSMGESDKP